MEKITKETLSYVAKLAHLKIDESSMTRYTEKMAAVIRYFEKLNELKTDHVEPTSHALNVTGGLQDDEVKQSQARDAILDNAPLLDGDFYAVPKVV
jgi:aspartyl-tRNA(Asn)/glutamyl-tRNA(Gln) amidotransferase subunit C